MCIQCREKPVYIGLDGRALCSRCFINYFEEKVWKTIRRYKLIVPGDKVLVACSGGKDSTTLLYLLNKFMKQRGASVEALTIDVGIGEYSKKNLANITAFCKEQKIKLHVTSFRKEIGSSACYLSTVIKLRGTKLTSCAICGMLKRRILNQSARKIGATKLATGHNLDDEAQSILMNLFKKNISTLARLGPKTGIAEHKMLIQRIKPLFFCSEKETTLYSKLKGFPVLYERCPCSENAFRRHIGKILESIEKEHPGTKHAIVASLMEMLPALKKKYAGFSFNLCKLCGEPTRYKICKLCVLLKSK